MCAVPLGRWGGARGGVGSGAGSRSGDGQQQLLRGKDHLTKGHAADSRPEALVLKGGLLDLIGRGKKRGYPHSLPHQSVLKKTDLGIYR